MTPTEHEGTVAVDAAARKMHELQRESMLKTGLVPDLPTWDDLNQLSKNSYREGVLPAVWAALEALPDRRREAWAEGWRAAARVVELEGEKTWAHTVFPEGYEGNPYGEA